MGFRNTSSSFGSVTKVLHWTIAAFFLLSYCSAYYSIWFTVDGTVANDIVMPITGYLGTYRDAEYLGITKFGDTRLFAWVAATFDTTWDQFERRFDFVHRDILGSKLLWALIVIHVGAALFHHVYRRDGVLTRMLPGRSAEAEQTADRSV